MNFYISDQILSMKPNFPKTALLLSLALLAAGCNNQPRPPGPSPRPVADTCHVNATWDFSKSELLINVRRADSLVRATREALKSLPTADSTIGKGPGLGENIWQYIFSTEGLAIGKGDTWYLHKANDRLTNQVCFVLEVVPKAGPAAYYKGRADCPRICGYAQGSLDEQAVTWYLNRPLQVQPSKDAANLLMRDPQVGRVHTIVIKWNQGVEYARTHGTALIQVVQTYTASGLLGEPLVFNIDEYGFVMGGVVKIPVSQLCIVSASDKCGLR
jgi:hypothetical protein